MAVKLCVAHEKIIMHKKFLFYLINLKSSWPYSSSPIGARQEKAFTWPVRNDLGPVVVIGEINFVSTLPKTRSGKIMRRVLRAVALEREPGDVSTIEDEGSVEEARQAWHQLKTEMTM